MPAILLILIWTAIQLRLIHVEVTQQFSFFKSEFSVFEMSTEVSANNDYISLLSARHLNLPLTLLESVI